MARSRRAGIAFALLCLGLLGALPILSNARPAGSDSLSFAVWLTFWQLAAALPLFLTELARGKHDPAAGGPRRPLRTRTATIAVATGAMFGLSTYMYVAAAERAGPVSMVIALQACPLFAMTLEALFLGRRKSARELIFIAIMLAALVYLTTRGTFRVSGISWWSVFALGIPLLWSVAHILLKHVLDTTPTTPSQVTVTRLAISGACLLLLDAALGRSGALSAALMVPGFQRAALLMGAAYYLELIFWFHAIRHVDVSLASSVTAPAPAVTMLIAVIVLGKGLEPYQVIAMGVITIGLYGLLLAGRRAPSGLRRTSPGHGGLRSGVYSSEAQRHRADA